MRSAIGSFPDDETGSFSAVHLGLTGEGSERGRLYEGAQFYCVRLVVKKQCSGFVYES